MDTATMSSAGLALALLLGGCARATPSVLLEARAAFYNSRDGQTARLSPAALREAEEALAAADQEFAAHGNTPAVEDRVYIARRKLELADSKARALWDLQRTAEAGRVGMLVQDGQLEAGRTALATSREERDEAREGREAAEARLGAAERDLAASAALREAPRGMVITLSGAFLFGSGKTALLPSAHGRLDQVAEALKAEGADKTMVVEGHTDGRGPDVENLQLSQDRAETVRGYLVTRGVDAKRIVAAGMGSSRPLADNASPESRADNRRVEIVVHSAPLPRQ